MRVWLMLVLDQSPPFQRAHREVLLVRNLHFRACESEAVWQVCLHGSPESIPLLLGHNLEFIVVLLKLGIGSR